MQTREIKYDDGVVTADLTVQAATTLIGARRGRLIAQGQQSGETDPDRLLLLLYSYPDLLAPTTGTINGASVAGLTFDAFLALPEQLVDAWGRAVYELNGHWLPEVVDEAKKEATPSTAA